MLRFGTRRGGARKPLLAVVGTAVAMMALAACSGGGDPATKDEGSDSDASSSSNSNATAKPASAASGDLNIYVVGGKADDPFFSTVKRGVDDATKIVEELGGKVNYLPLSSYENLGPDAAKLTQTAVSNNASIILVPNWVPESQNPAIEKAIDAGIPVILYNSGADQVDEVGAITYIGADDYDAGVAGGEFLAQNDVTNALCVNTVPGAANLEARCDGAAEGAADNGGKVTQLPLPASNFGNPTAVAQAIKAALLKDDTVDGLITMGGQDADSAASALKQANLTDKVALATFNLDKAQMEKIQAGEEMVAIDQQGYLQGFYSVTAAYQYQLYGLKLASDPVMTGPLLVTKDNVEQALAGADAGVR